MSTKKDAAGRARANPDCIGVCSRTPKPPTRAGTAEARPACQPVSASFSCLVVVHQTPCCLLYWRLWLHVCSPELVSAGLIGQAAVADTHRSTLSISTFPHPTAVLLACPTATGPGVELWSAGHTPAAAHHTVITTPPTIY